MPIIAGDRVRPKNKLYKVGYCGFVETVYTNSQGLAVIALRNNDPKDWFYLPMSDVERY